MEKANLFDLVLGLLLSQPLPKHLTDALRDATTNLPIGYQPGRWSTYREMHHLLSKSQAKYGWLVWPRVAEHVKPESAELLWLFADASLLAGSPPQTLPLRQWFDEMHRSIRKNQQPWFVVVCLNWHDRWFKNELQAHCESMALRNCPVIVLHCTDRAGSIQYIHTPKTAA